ncbi:DUF4402 domain-containing protein [Mucilaginibacter sp.]|uniref:DUF4402 domain-containing protein n=1 Tax=Mucilaginibacter sp. TaxID=1882438 RepID=UPI0025F5F47C|nr:DUF4402 domain-containing protein [Mucilaginibacter sp.]
MKTVFKLAVTLIAVFSFPVSSSFAQVSANALITGTIVTPISISKTVDVNFGNIAISGAAGTVILAPSGVRTVTGGVTLPSVSGTLTAASFTITGQGSYTYSITLPSSPLTISSGANNMSVDKFTSSTAATGTLSSGTQTFHVGATLNIAGNQSAGTYFSATPFNVTVNYN